MTKFKKLLLILAFGCTFSPGVFAAQDLIVTPIKAMPAVVVESTVVSDIQYQVTNVNSTDTYNVTFSNLNTLGKTFTTTCGSLAPSATCLINITFTVPALPAGKTSEYYPQTFFVLGAPNRVPYGGLSTTIIQSAPSIAPTSDITFASPGPCTGTFTVVLTGSDSVDHTYSSVACGVSTLSPSLPGGAYNAHITPATVTSGINNYDAPADFSYHLAKAGDTANFPYTLNSDISVTTDLTMPSAGVATSTISCNGPGGTYGPHNQAVGTLPFDTMKPGSYTCTATNYTGLDTNVYVPTLVNPYTISALPGQDVIAITFTEQAPSTRQVSTIITAPNLPTGQTVAITLADVGNTYGPHNQPAGTTVFDHMVDASDYALTCANYTVGSDVYACTPSDPYPVDASHTTVTIVYTKKAPPGANYNWQASHVPDLKTHNVAAVILGGGSTTGPVYIETNPPANTKVIATIESYETSPTPVQPTAQIKLFPAYIAMGSVSAVTTDVTNQFKAQHLDVDNHYEGNGDANAGCFWPQKNASGAVGGNQVDYFYIGTQNAGLLPFNWTTTPTTTNLVPAGTYTVSGDQFRANVTGGYQYFDAKIGTPIQVDGTHITIPITYVPQKINTSNNNPTIANNGTVTFGVPTYISTNITYPQGSAAPVTSITSASGIATVTSTSPHGLASGATVIIAGATQSPYNGSFVITVTGANTFTYAVSGSPASPATGTITMTPVYVPPSSEILMGENMCGGYFYAWGGYTPQIDAMATQAAAVKATNSHTLIYGNVLYTTRFSDGGSNILDDITNPLSVTTAFFNLMYDAQRMEYQWITNGVPSVMLLNPDSTWLFQNCSQYYCPLAWKPGISQDPNSVVLANPNMQSAIFAALDKMESEGYLSSGEVTTLKTDFTTNGILTPTAGRTVAGIPEYMLAVGWVMKNFATHIPFGQGNNVYDSTNPLLLPSPPGGKTAAFQTGSATWIHKVNHVGLGTSDVAAAIAFQSQRYCTYMNDMNWWGKAGNYAQDYFYGDKYERDEIVNFIGTADGLPHPQGTYVNTGYEFNGVDWDTTLAYYGGIATCSGNKPLILWQMPGSQLYTSDDTPPGVVGTFTEAIASLTSTGGVATLTTPTAHGLTTGAAISVQYANQPEYNGNFTATVTGATTFTYPISGTPASPATPAPGVPAIIVGGLPGTEYWGSTTPTWIFGDTTLKNDLTNVNYNLGVPQFLWTADMNNSIYFTKNSGVLNNQDYLKLTSAAALTTKAKHANPKDNVWKRFSKWVRGE